MRHIDRLPKPQILRRKQKEWTENFLNSGKARPDSSKYTHKEIVETLMNMSYGKCFYSEKSIKGESREVDHLMEVGVDRTKAFEWDNLYLSCKECNNGRPDARVIPLDQVLDP